MHPHLARMLASAILVVPVVALGQAPKPPAPAKTAAAPAQSTKDDTLYALGATIGRNLEQFRLTPAELEVVKRGMTDAVTGQKLKVDPATQGKAIQAFADNRRAVATKANREAGKAYAAKAATATGAEKTKSGLIFTSLAEGSGATPKPDQTAKINFSGMLVDGTIFEDGKQGPVNVPLSNTFPCLSEGLKRMKVGGKARMVCPPEIAFGDEGRPPAIGGGSTVVLNVELLDVTDTPTPKMPPGHGAKPAGGGMPPGHGEGGPPKK